MKSKKLRHLPMTGLLISSLAFSVSAFAQSSIELGTSTCVDDGATPISVPILFANGDNVSSYQFNLSAPADVTFTGNCTSSLGSHISVCATNGVGLGVSGFSVATTALPAALTEIVTVEVTVANGAGCPQTMDFDFTGPPAAAFGDTANADITAAVLANLTTDNSNGIGGPIVAPTCTITAPAFTAVIPPGSGTTTQDVTITAGPVALSNVAAALATGAEFSIPNPNACATIAANASCQLPVTFATNAIGAFTDTLTATGDGNAAGDTTCMVTLNGTGLDATPVGPFPQVTPPLLSFGETAGSMDITITNVDNAGAGEATQALNFTAILDATGLTSADGSFAFNNTTCGASLAAGASCTVTIDYDPAADTDAGDFDEGSYLVSFANAEDVTVAIAGGTNPIPTLSEWAMIIMATLMLLFGIVTMRRNGYLH